MILSNFNILLLIDKVFHSTGAVKYNCEQSGNSQCIRVVLHGTRGPGITPDTRHWPSPQLDTIHQFRPLSDKGCPKQVLKYTIAA